MGICQCNAVVTSSPPVCGSGCVYTPNMLVTDSVTYCDAMGVIDIAPVVDICEGTPNYYIYSYENVANPTINATQITFEPVNNGTFVAEIKYLVACGEYSDLGTITIIYNNNCLDVLCPDGGICDPCTGVCGPGLPDLSVDSPGEGIDLSITP